MENEQQRRAALVYHAKPRPGKTKVVPTKNYDTQRDLALAYSPGVAIPCLEIEKKILQLEQSIQLPRLFLLQLE